MALLVVSTVFAPCYGETSTRKNWGISKSERYNCRVLTGLGEKRTSFLRVTCSGVMQPGGQVLTTSPGVELKIPHHSSAWKQFVDRSSGEWDGYGADFNSLGQPHELPSQVVPDAFRDWGVEVYDWQTMCPTLGLEDPETLGYRVLRMLPTVGCEADAATSYCTEENDLGKAVTCAFHPNGSYTAVWPGVGVMKENPNVRGTSKIVVRNLDANNEWEVEHCLVSEEKSNRKRARILQHLRINVETNIPELKKITVYIEQWEGPFRNGESLGGCSVGGSGFATTGSLQLLNLVGTWNVDSFVATEESSPKLLDFRGSTDVERSDVGEVVALPNNLWSSVKTSNASSSYLIEAGWLVNSGQSIVSSLEYLPSGEFQNLSLKFEQKR